MSGRVFARPAVSLERLSGYVGRRSDVLFGVRAVRARALERAPIGEFHHRGPLIADGRLGRVAKFYERWPLALVTPDFERVGLETKKLRSLLRREQVIEVNCGH